MIATHVENNFESWRMAARPLLARRIRPNAIIWSGRSQGLLYEAMKPKASAPAELRVPGKFIRLAEAVACYDDDEKWPLLYRILYRLTFENKDLLNIESDTDVRAAKLMEKGVSRDVHKFHAFVRFRQIKTEGDEIYAAWHEPQHWCVERATPFFERRFGSMKWSIFTPKGCAHWDLKELTFSPPADPSMAPATDEMEDFWRLYYRSIFNPFRLNVKTMKREMPVRHWSTLPEADLIPELIREAAAAK
jgi:probable DNA metabolism protein